MPSASPVAILDAAFNPMLLVDSKGRVRLANRAFSEIFPPVPGGVAGKTLRSLYGGALDAPGLRPLLERARVRDVPFSEFEFSTRFAGGDRRTLRLAARRIPAANGLPEGLLVGIDDITSLRRNEASEAGRTRESSQREFIANISHELRTPVAAIRGFAETLLQGGLEDGRNRRRFVQAIERHATRLIRLVEDLVEAAARQRRARGTVRPVKVNLRKFVTTMVSDLHPLAEARRVSLESRITSPLYVRVDRRQLAHVLQNLLENGIDYNRRKGRVSVTAARKPGRVVLSVHDTGIGIGKADLERVFDRFHRSNRARVVKPGGSGLGLAIVRDIVESMGGRAWAESRPGKGSVFHISIPEAKE